MPSAPVSSYLVRILTGADRDKQWTLDTSLAAPLLVGTSSSCEVRLSDRAISRRHCSLEVDEGRLHVVDLQSSNGTWLNGIEVREAWVQAKATLQLGAVRLELCPASHQAAPTPSQSDHFGALWGQSLAMRRLYPLCERLAYAPVPVLIEGETGTGKEILAEALHAQGPHSAGPFVVFDCTAVSASLIEAELFGHAKGAFTGATTARKGVFEAAHGGTLFIDEVGDLPLHLQASLLRAVERSEVRPVGSHQTVRFQARVVAATRRNLDHEVEHGRFRDDLFHRISVARVVLPPLRRRKGDITFLAHRFYREFGDSTIAPSQEMLQRWEDEPWPGNVRELRNRILRHLTFGDWDWMLGESQLDPGSGSSAAGASSRTVGNAAAATAASATAHSVTAIDVAATPRRPPAATGLPWPSAWLLSSFSEGKQLALRAFEQAYVERLLERHQGNVTQAAREAGIARRYLQMLRARERGQSR